MSYKTILVHCDGGRGVGIRLMVGADLACRFDARLVALHAREPFELASFSEGTIPVTPLLDAYKRAGDAAEQTARASYGKATKGREIASEWRVFEAFADEALAVGARYADLVVVGQADPDDADAGRADLPEVTALATGRPVLVIPRIGAPESIGRTVMLCWNAGRECARAAGDALPFLRAAGKVIVLVVDPHVTPTGHGEEPGADVATWLARHGVNVSVQREVGLDNDVGNIILSRAADFDVDLIVMGIYGHSRVREMILGGASRTLLASMTVPVLMSH